MAENVDGQLIIWGGKQKQPDGKILPLPSNVVYSFTPNDQSGIWNVKKATGSVHPGTSHLAFIVLDSKIYIQGGDTGGWNFTDALSTLSADGHFERVSPMGEIPSPRRDHRAFTYQGKLYFFGGYVQQVDEARKEDFVESKLGVFYNNDFHEYDPKSRRFSRLKIRGARISPRIGSAIATNGQQVFIHGGERNGKFFKDFYLLDLNSLEFTEIKQTVFNDSNTFHTATSFFQRYLFFAGGETPGQVSNQVKIFDAKSFRWKEEEPMSSEIGKGLWLHRAIKFPREKGFSLICVGGYIYSPSKTHPSHMVLFDITHG